MIERKIRSVVISGATGALGNALINECIERNIEVLVLCRKNSVRTTNIPQNSGIKIKFCSLDDYEDIQNDTGKQYDVFYHLAWEGTTGSSRNNVYLQHKNIKYTLDAVDVAKRFGCTMFIGAGSQAEYGRKEERLTPETPTLPESGYGVAKLCAGQMSRIHARELGIEHLWIRILSVYGPCDGNSMVMSVIRSLHEGKIPQCTKGEQMWDYLYSKDAARAFLDLASTGVNEKTYVLGSGELQPLAFYIKTIRDVVKPDGKIAFGAVPYSEEQVMYLGCTISDLERDISFRANTNFAEGIKKTFNWYKLHSIKE